MKRKPGLIIVDASTSLLAAVAALADPFFNVLKTVSPRRGVEWLASEKNVTVFVVEQKLPGLTGLQLLAAAQARRPRVRRVLLTSFGELSEVIEGLHSGVVQALVEKPLRGRELLAAIRPEMTLATPARKPRASDRPRMARSPTSRGSEKAD